MRIALVTPGGFDPGGRERVIPALLWLVERLARRHDVCVFVLRADGKAAAYELKRAVTYDGPGEVGIIRSKSAPHFAPYLTPIQGEINMPLEANFGRYVKGVQYASMTLLLRDFVRELERQYGGPISTINVNAAEVISDFCRYLGLSDENRRKVLGVDGAQYIAMIENVPLNSTIKH